MPKIHPTHRTHQPIPRPVRTPASCNNMKMTERTHFRAAEREPVASSNSLRPEHLDDCECAGRTSPDTVWNEPKFPPNQTQSEAVCREFYPYLVPPEPLDCHASTLHLTDSR
jgi:hypothetical protein